MEKSNSLIEGILIGEQKNRFLCNVKIGDRIEECYIPSSCRLSNLISIKNPRVILRKVTSKNSRTNYAIYAIKIKRSFALIDLVDANKILYKQINRRMFSFLGSRKEILSEVSFGKYRADIFIKDTSTIIEVKTVISDLPTALFPSIHSERAIKQLESISNLLGKGYHAYLFILALTPSIKKIVISNQEKEFLNILDICCQKGLIIHGFNLKISGGIANINNKIPVEIQRKP